MARRNSPLLKITPNGGIALDIMALVYTPEGKTYLKKLLEKVDPKKEYTVYEE